jgi:hypothetical protein
MLDETLIIWSGEFGRTPMSQTNKGLPGRDHHMKSFSLWMCGGGVKGGMTYGETDELGYNAVVDPVHVNDLHATMLHQLGIDHERLTFRSQGRDYRLTDVAGRVLRDVLAYRSSFTRTPGNFSRGIDRPFWIGRRASAPARSARKVAIRSADESGVCG